MKKIAGLIVGLSLMVPSFALASVGITLTGGNVTVIAGQPFVEPGYSAVSSYDGNITGSVVVTGANTSTVGMHTVNYNVTDSNEDSASASRGLNVLAGGGMIACSGPLAPGWNVSLPDGGCGGGSSYIPYGKPLGGKFGSAEICNIMFGCMVKN